VSREENWDTGVLRDDELPAVADY